MTVEGSATENGPEEPDVGSSSPFQLQEIIGAFLHYKWLVLGCMVLAIVGESFYLGRQRPVYQARATIVIEPAAPKVLNNVNEVGELGVMAADDSAYYATQYKILGSNSLIAEAIMQLQRQSLAAKRDKEKDKGRATAPAPVIPMPDHDAVDSFKSKITIMPVALTHLVNVDVSDHDPAQAALLANTLAEVYIERNLAQKTEASRTALSWLEVQSEELQERLRDSEVALNQFKRTNNVVSVSPQEGQNILASELTSVSSALTSTRIRRMGLAAQMAELESAVKSPGGENALTLVPNHEHINLLIARRKSLLLAAAQIEARYLPDHPKAVEARVEAERVERLIAIEVPATLAVVQRDLNTAKRFEADLNTRLEQVKGNALDLNSRETDYNRIQREYETNKSLYTMVLTRSKETNLTRRLETNNARILDHAYVARNPIGRARTTTMALATTVGFLLGLGLAFLLGQLDQSVKSQEDITIRARLPFLGIIPSLAADSRAGRRSHKIGAEEQALLVHTHPKSMTAETCRAIRSNLLFTSPDNPLRTIAVTSPQRADGKTSTAVKLAVILSQTQGKTLIVDADMRRPRLQEIFGVPNETGLSTVISGECTLQDAIKRTEIPGVDVLTSGRIPPNAAELLHSKRFAALVAELRELYSMIVFDTPPVLAVTDAVVLGTQVDGVVVVARWRSTSRHAVRDAYLHLREVGGRVLGIVLNDLNPRKGAYYYRYRSYGRYQLQAGKAEA